MPQSLEMQVGRIEQKQQSQEKICDERDKRVTTDISNMWRTIEIESSERREIVQRIHTRLDDVIKVQASMETTLESLPGQIASKIEISAKGGQIWVFTGVMVIIGILITLAEHFIK